MFNNFNNAPISPLTGVPGWETPGEQLMLAQLASAVRDGGIIVEIGSEFGMSTSILAKYSPPACRVFAIDLFPGDGAEIHAANMQKLGWRIADKITQLKGKSVEIAAGWKSSNEISLLFIDGDHSTEGVILDIEHWLPYVKYRGVVAFHDAVPMSNLHPHPDHYAVQEAINIWQRSKASQAKQWGYIAQEFVDVGCVDSMRIFCRVAKKRKPTKSTTVISGPVKAVRSRKRVVAQVEKTNRRKRA